MAGNLWREFYLEDGHVFDFCAIVKTYDRNFKKLNEMKSWMIRHFSWKEKILDFVSHLVLQKLFLQIISLTSGENKGGVTPKSP